MNTTTPENCPKCGDELFHSSNAHQEFKCTTLVLKGGTTFEGGDCAKRQRDQLAERVKELEAALDLVVPTCEHLHHEKKYRHFDHEPCPVREIVMKAKGLK